MLKKPAIFLDRDNTLVHDDGYIYEIEKFAWINGATAALKRFHEANIPVFIVTNQGGIGVAYSAKIKCINSITINYRC